MTADPRSSRPQRSSLLNHSQRWDRRPRAVPDFNEAAGRPSRIIVGGIGILCIIMTAGVVTIWRAGLWEPGQVSAETNTAARAAHEAIAASLDSARTYMTQGEWGKAEAILMHAAEQFPIDQEIRIALGETLLAQQRHEESYEQYAKALAIGPREPALEFVAGQVASTAGLHQSAIDHFNLAQRGDPFNASYPLMLGMVERQLGRTDAARASLLRAANIDPQNAFAWGTLADISLADNNVNLALQHIARARQLQPESREWRLIEARARKRRGEAQQALMLLMGIEPSQRREAPVLRQIAECFGMLGRHTDAANAWADGAAAHPDDPIYAFEAALAWDRAGDREKALQFARQAHALGYDRAEALVERFAQ